MFPNDEIIPFCKLMEAIGGDENIPEMTEEDSSILNLELAEI